MSGQQRWGGAGRGAAAVGLAVFLVGAGAASSHADSPTDPLTTVTGPVTTTVTGPVTTVTGPVTTTVTRPVTTTVAGAVGKVAGSATPLKPGAGAGTHVPTAAAPTAKPSSSQPSGTTRTSAPAGTGSRRSGRTASVQGPAASRNRVAAVDVRVGAAVGACARITSGGVPFQTTIVVLDVDLVASLLASGVPLDDLLVPCPRGTAGAVAAASGGGSIAAAASVGAARPGATGGSAGDAAGSSLADRLAFTGGGLMPLGVAGVLLLAIGAACSSHSRALRRAAPGG
jgi:hypothetical protein